MNVSILHTTAITLCMSDSGCRFQVMPGGHTCQSTCKSGLHCHPYLDKPRPSGQRHLLLLLAYPQDPSQGQPGLGTREVQSPLLPLQLQQQGLDDRGAPQQLGEACQHAVEQSVGQGCQFGIAAAAGQVFDQHFGKVVDAWGDAADVIHLSWQTSYVSDCNRTLRFDEG